LKIWNKVVDFVKNNWKEVAKWIAEWGIIEAIEYIIKLLS
jgi:hypothetical protein